ncbi:P-loop ATPase, Sll1717 family [Moritella viscosa]|uniref:ATPase n=1 Tax=Moritella viscosa TaxID=80854 RepID=A0A1L0ARV6_9GAMM|nr:DNA repair protein [Moritella viscosa]SGZ20498.1 ATPase [Moritella viscosa]
MSSYKFRKNAEIGKLEAETDSFLSSCFYESDVFKGLINFDSSEKNPDFTRRIIVGRTGSGKTALLKQILGSNSVKVHDTIEAENTVFEHINNNVFISDLMDKGVDLRVFYKSLWLHVLLVKVINLLYRSSYNSFFEYIKNLYGKDKTLYKPELANEYLESYKDNFFNENIVSEISNKMQDELSGKFGSGLFNTTGKVSEEHLKKIQSATSSYVSKELLRKQKELIKIIKAEFSNEKQIRVIISIDDLDKSWLSSSSIRYDFINALLEAFKELLDLNSVKILISIRTDIIMGIYNNTLRQDEKDQSLIYAISWNKKEIRQILDDRINHLIKNQYQSSRSVTFSDVFDFKVASVKADEFIINRTMLRPKDAINFVNLCLSECDGQVELNEDIVLTAEEKFYSVRKQALIKEWLSIFIHIKDYLDSLSFISDKSFKIAELAENDKNNVLEYLLSRPHSKDNDEEHNNRLLEFEELVKVWFIVGIIGIKKSDTLIIYSSFEKPELDITDLKRQFEIHPLFFRH